MCGKGSILTRLLILFRAHQCVAVLSFTRRCGAGLARPHLNVLIVNVLMVKALTEALQQWLQAKKQLVGMKLGGLDSRLESVLCLLLHLTELYMLLHMIFLAGQRKQRGLQQQIIAIQFKVQSTRL